MLLAVVVQAQKKFENEYYINREGERKIVQIFNEDWAVNPVSITVSENGAERMITVANAKEFGIDGGNVCEANTVDYDMSSSNVDKLSKKYEPEYEQKNLFLRKIVSGKYPLYEHYAGSEYRYFYKDQSGNVIPLVYKRYFFQNKNDIYQNSTEAVSNNTFQKQISKLSNNEIDGSAYSYRKSSLAKAFEKLNGEKMRKSEKGETKFGIKAGVAFMKASIVNVSSRKTEVSFGSKTVPTAGLQFEYVFPLNRKALSIGAETNYYAPYETDENVSIYNAAFDTYNNYKLSVSFSTFNIGVMGKYRYFFNEKAAAYIRPQILWEKVLNRTIQNVYITETGSQSYVLVGGSIGLEYKKFFIDFPAYRSVKASANTNIKSYALTAGYYF